MTLKGKHVLINGFIMTKEEIKSRKLIDRRSLENIDPENIQQNLRAVSMSYDQAVHKSLSGFDFSAPIKRMQVILFFLVIYIVL